MLSNIICAGLGGQGVLTLGMLLAEIAASQGKYVTWVPEYAGTMRGGKANVVVKISDDPIINPYMEEADILVALDAAPLAEFKDKLEENSWVLVEDSLVKDVSAVENKKVLSVPAVEIAGKLGNPKGMSVAVVGAIIAGTDMFPFEEATEAIGEYFAHKGLPVDKNKAVFEEGYRFIKEKM